VPRLRMSIYAGLGAVLVAAMGIHAAATFSLYSLLYGALCGAMMHGWLKLRRKSENEDRARDVDGLFLMALFFAAQVASPAFAWFDSLFSPP
jgi:hypothetical protein